MAVLAIYKLKISFTHQLSRGHRVVKPLQQQVIKSDKTTKSCDKRNSGKILLILLIVCHEFRKSVNNCVNKLVIFKNFQSSTFYVFLN